MATSRYGSILDEPADVSSFSLDDFSSTPSLAPRRATGSRFGSILDDRELSLESVPMPEAKPSLTASDFLHKLTYPLTLPKRAMDYVVREAANLTNEYGNRLPEEATTGSLARAAAGLNPTDQGQGYAERLGGRALEFGVDLATDPFTVGMGALPKAVGRGAAAAFAPSMALSAIEEGKHAADLYREQGFSPEMAEATLGAGLSGAFAYGAGRHALESPVPRMVPRPVPEPGITREEWAARRIPQSLDEMPLPEPLPIPELIPETPEPIRATPVEPEPLPVAPPEIVAPEPIPEPAQPILEAAPPEIPVPTPEPVVRMPRSDPWEMTPEELDTAIGEAAGQEKSLDERILGKEGAKRYNQLQGRANSSDQVAADAAYKEIQKIEAGLSEAQRRTLFGIDEPGVSAEDFKSYRKVLGSLDFDSPEALGDSLKYAVTRVNGKSDPATMNQSERLAYAQIRHGYEVAQANGWDTAAISKRALSGAAERFSDPADAAFMLREITGRKRSARPALNGPESALPAPTADLGNREAVNPEPVPVRAAPLSETKPIESEAPRQAKVESEAERIRRHASEFADSGRIDDSVFEDIADPEARERIRSQASDDAVSLITGRDTIERFRRDHPADGPDGIEKIGDGDSYDIIQRKDGQIVGGAEVRNGSLAMIAGGKALGSPVSIRPVYELLDSEGVKRNDVLTSMGKRAREALKARTNEQVPGERIVEPENRTPVVRPETGPALEGRIAEVPRPDEASLRPSEGGAVRGGEQLAVPPKPVPEVQEQRLSTRSEGGRPTKPLTVDRVKTSIPGLEFTEKDGGFVAPLKNGGELRVNEVGEIEIRSPERLKESEEAAGQQGRPVGEYRSIGRNALINVAEGAPDGTVDHEGYHFIREFALSERERAAASKRYGNEEAEAYAYAKWAQSRVAPNSWFSKIMSYAKRLVHNFRPTWESTFEEVATGRAAQRIKGEATSEPRYAVTPKNQKIGPLGDDKIGAYEQMVDRMNLFKLMGERAKAPENFTENPSNRLRTMNSRKSELERQVREDFDEPIAKLLKDSKISLEDAWKYMYAKHAVDANPEYAKRTPGAHSGMSTVEAQKIIAKEKAKGRTKVLDQAQKEVNKLNDKVLDYGVETGLWTKSQVADWKKTWGENWLALRHNVDPDGNAMPAPPAGGRSGLRGKEVKTREGATTEAFNPLVATLDRAIRVFRRGEENMVWRNFDGLLKKEPALKDVYEVVDKLPQEKVLDRSGEYVGFKEGGEQKYLRFKNPDHVKVLASLNPPEADVIAKTVQKVTRTMAALSTRWNPAFALLGNPIMDVTEAVVNAKVEHGGRVAKDIASGLGDAYRAAKMGIKGKKPKNKADQALLDEFNDYRKNGGPMGNFSLLTLGEREAAMKHAIEGDRPVIASFKAVRDAIGKQGETLEAMTRFAGYRAFRKSGMSPAKAIMASRDLTVDFERAGLLGHQIGRYYAFFNAGIQGTNKMIRVVRSNPKAAAGVIGGLMALGVVNDQVNRAVWGDQDQDGVNDWDQVPQYVKENHLMLGSKKVPLPRGWRFFNALGVNLSQLASKTVSPETAAWNTVLSLNGLANPLGEGLSGKDTAKGLGIMATPTAAKPVAEVLLNQTALGGPVRPDQPKFGGKKPDSQLAFKNVNPIAKAIAEGLNRITGGDKVTPGYVDISPESIEQLFTSYSGGLGKTVSQVAGTTITLAKGEKPETRQVPIASRFLYEESPTQQATNFYTNKEQLEEALARQKKYTDEYRKSRDAKLLPKIAEVRKLTGAQGAFDAAERELKRLADAKKVVEARKGDTTQIDNSMKAAYTRANRAAAEARKRAGLPVLSASH